MKKKWIWIGAGAVLLIVLVVVNMARSSGGKAQSVQLAKVRVEDVTARVKAPGKIEPKTQVKVSADVPGKIIKLAVEEGDPVRKGQLLLQLDDTQYRSTWNQARASLSSARARFTDAKASLKVAEDNYTRQKSLFEQKLLSQAEWDRATASIETARSTAATSQEDVSRAEATITAAADNLSKCRFVAPFDGVVSALNVEQGEIVMIGTMNNPGTQIMVVSDLSRMMVRADVDEADIVDIRHGQKARITVDALPDTSFAATVIEIGNTAKRSLTGAAAEGQTNFEVQVVFDHTVPEVRPGMTADIEVETGTHPKAKAVPIQAVVVRTDRELERANRKPGQKARRSEANAAEEDTAGRKEKEITGLFVVKNDVATFVPVKAGLASETMIEITGDLKEGDSVVSGPYKALRELKPGAKVKREGAGGGGKKKG